MIATNEEREQDVDLDCRLDEERQEECACAASTLQRSNVLERHACIVTTTHSHQIYKT